MFDLIENATIHLRVSNFLCQKFFPPIFVSENQDSFCEHTVHKL